MVAQLAYQAALGVLTSPGIGGPATRLLEYGANDLMPIEVPQLDEYIQAWLNGVASHVKLKSLARMRGVDLPAFDMRVTRYAAMGNNNKVILSSAFTGHALDSWEVLLRNRTYVPTIDEVLHLERRELISENASRYMLGRQLDSNPALVDMWRNSNYEIPGPADLIRFVVREAYNPGLVQQYGYHHEFPTEVLPWMKKQGYGGSTGIQIPPQGTTSNGTPREGEASWTDLYWWAHWELPSLSQGYEMLHRLYDNSPFGPSPDVINGRFFMPPDLELLQKAQDIPDYWRTRLQSISYLPMHQADADYMFENDMITESELYHELRRHGYDNATCLRLIEMMKRRKARNHNIDPAKVTADWVCTHYKQGLISDIEFVDWLSLNGYIEGQAENFLLRCQLEVKSETAMVQVKHMEQAYLRGIFSEPQVKQEMLSNGMNPGIVEHFIKRWRYKRNVKIKQVSALQVKRFYIEGVITQQEAQARLFNLGYDGGSVSIILQSANAKIAGNQLASINKQIKKAQQTVLAQQKAILKAQKEQTKLAKEMAAKKKAIDTKRTHKLVVAATDKNIVEWWKKDLILLWEIYYRLYYKDYLIADADRWVRSNMTGLTEAQYHAAETTAKNKYGSESNPPLV